MKDQRKLHFRNWEMASTTLTKHTERWLGEKETNLKIHNDNFTSTTKRFKRQVACWSYLQTALRDFSHDISKENYSIAKQF